MSKIKLIEVKSDLGGRKAGASLGSDAIRIASYQNESNFYFYSRFEKELYEQIVAPNTFFHAKIKYPFSKRIAYIVPIYEQICDSVAEGVKNSDFTIVISGDHSTAGGTIAGIKKANPNKKIGVVWIDAHADVHNPLTTDSGNLHGMPVSTAINDDNSDCAFNSIDDETRGMWEKLKNVGGTKNKLNMSDVVYVGLRDYEYAEETIIAKYCTKVFRTTDLRHKGAKETAHAIMKHLEYCDIIYVSFDVDSLDPSVSVGTGTPFEGGLYAYEAKELIKTLVASEKVKCFEISEVNPTLDTNNKMATVAFRILKMVCRVVDLRFAE